MIVSTVYQLVTDETIFPSFGSDTCDDKHYSDLPDTNCIFFQFSVLYSHTKCLQWRLWPMYKMMMIQWSGLDAIPFRPIPDHACGMSVLTASRHERKKVVKLVFMASSPKSTSIRSAPPHPCTLRSSGKRARHQVTWKRARASENVLCRRLPRNCETCPDCRRFCRGHGGRRAREMILKNPFFIKKSNSW